MYYVCIYYNYTLLRCIKECVWYIYIFFFYHRYIGTTLYYYTITDSCSCIILSQTYDAHNGEHLRCTICNNPYNVLGTIILLYSHAYYNTAMHDNIITIHYNNLWILSRKTASWIGNFATSLSYFDDLQNERVQMFRFGLYFSMSVARSI